MVVLDRLWLLVLARWQSESCRVTRAEHSMAVRVDGLVRALRRLFLQGNWFALEL
jgi:hypothetical protein